MKVETEVNVSFLYSITAELESKEIRRLEAFVTEDLGCDLSCYYDNEDYPSDEEILSECLSFLMDHICFSYGVVDEKDQIDDSFLPPYIKDFFNFQFLGSENNNMLGETE